MQHPFLLISYCVHFVFAIENLKYSFFEIFCPQRIKTGNYTMYHYGFLTDFCIPLLKTKEKQMENKDTMWTSSIDAAVHNKLASPLSSP